MQIAIKDSKIINSFMGLQSERWGYRLALVGVGVFSLLLISSIMTNIYRLSALAISSENEITTISYYHRTIHPNLNKISNITLGQLALFGTMPAAVASMSNYTLLGIESFSKNPSTARAIISNNSGDEDHFYAIGDKIAPGVIVDAIGPDSVILIHNGIKEQLIFTWEDSDLISHDQGSAANLAQPQSLPNTIYPGQVGPNNPPININQFFNSGAYKKLILPRP